jgi:hypothetical protein
MNNDLSPTPRLQAVSPSRIFQRPDPGQAGRVKVALVTAVSVVVGLILLAGVASLLVGW